jgi:GrpB-like predicted nucleotidyltransferase (UPF0157 family)
LDQFERVIGIYTTPPTTCKDYDPRYAEVAWQVSVLISEHLPQVRVEHVGSTSVPGCAGKGIVDLMIAVRAGEMDTVKQVLDELGFQPQTGRDPFPEDRPMRVGSFCHDGQTFLFMST